MIYRKSSHPTDCGTVRQKSCRVEGKAVWALSFHGSIYRMLTLLFTSIPRKRVKPLMTSKAALLCFLIITGSAEASTGPLKTGNPFLMWLGGFIGSGHLSRGHTQLDDIRYCFDCHDLFLGIPDEKCKKCHNDLISVKNRGAHRLWTEACVKCHDEHNGFEARLFYLDKNKFPHDKTAFPLLGKHKDVLCEKCHKRLNMTPKNRASYLGAPLLCSSCHSKSPHPNIKDNKCKTCHTTSTWKELGKVQSLTSIEHDEFNFRLSGKHISIKCNKCHKDNKFTKLSFKECKDCHKDPHNAQFGKRKCKKCHDAKSWKKTLFDHSKTRFKLVGFHKRPMCKSCHPNKVFTSADPACKKCHDDSYRFFKGFLPWNREKHPDKMSRLLNCMDCHGADDPIDNVEIIKKRCVKCHNEYYSKLFDYWKNKMSNMFNNLIPYIIKLSAEDRTEYNKRFIFLRKKYFHNIALSRIAIKNMEIEMKEKIRQYKR